MPQYINPPQLPTGLAEETVRLAQQGSLGANLAGVVGDVSKALATTMASNRTRMPTEQAIALGLIPATIEQDKGGFYPPGQIPADYGGERVQIPSSQVFGPRLSPTALASAQKIKESEMGMNKLLAVQNLKNTGNINVAEKKGETAQTISDNKLDAAMQQSHKPLTQAMIDNNPQVKKMGLAAGQMIPNAMFDNLAKVPPTPKGVIGSPEDTKLWMKIQEQYDPIIAGRGKPLGIIAQNNIKANRLISILSKPDATNEEIKLGVMDLAGIMASGKADEQAIKATTYKTLRGDMASWATYLTSNPQAANTPGIRKRMLQKAMEIKKVDNDQLEGHFRSGEVPLRDFISKDPKRWLDFKNRVMNSQTDSTSTPESRYNELKQFGHLSDDDIYKQLHIEGYR